MSNGSFKDCMDLLLIRDYNKSHYVYIKDFNKPMYQRFQQAYVL